MPYTQSGSIPNIKEPTTNISVAVKEAMDLKNLVDDPKKLQTHDTHISPDEAYRRLKAGDQDPLLVKIAAKDSYPAFYYAKFIKTAPFPLGEPAIAKDSTVACWYASDVLKGPFPLGEPAIATHSNASYLYAKTVLKGPFPLGEPAIARIAINSVNYAYEVLKGPFPLGEPAIAKDEDLANEYEKFVLKGRPWTGLDQKVDEAIDLKNLVSDPTRLKTHDTHVGPIEAYKRILHGKKEPNDEQIVAKDPQCSFLYARYVLHKPWPPGEPAIAKDASYSYLYAVDVLMKSFPLGEPAIATDTEQSYMYAKDVLQRPFPLGEPAIAKDAEASFLYATYILKDRFPLGEPAIKKDASIVKKYRHFLRNLKSNKKTVKEAIDLNKLVTDPTKLKTYGKYISPKEAYERLKKGETDEYLLRAVAKDAEYSFHYAADVLKKSFPLGEPAIAKDAGYSCLYAVEVLKGPFPLGEPIIATDTEYSFFYAMDALKGPFPLGEPAIKKNARIAKRYRHFLRTLKNKKKTVKEAINLKNLVSDPTKLKTHDTHIGPKEAYERLKKGETDEYLLRAVAKDKNLATEFARFVLKGPFPLGEPVIAKDAYHAYHYVRDVLKGPFPLGEPAIAKDPVFSFAYAKDTLKGPFPLGEPAIAKDTGYAYAYAKYILKGPFPLGEPTIAKNLNFAYYYAKDVLKGPFPLGEPVIRENPYTAELYKKNILKGRPWTGLKKKKVKESMDLKKLVSDPTKLETHKTHISPKEAYERLSNGETNEYLVHAISKSAEYSYDYAKRILKGPFPLGEPAIAKEEMYSYDYAVNVLKKSFPLGEPAIAKDAMYSYNYALNVLKKKPFPLGEPAIAKDIEYSYWYARDILNGPFPLGEPVIATDAWYSHMYSRNALKGRPWTDLDQKVDEAIDLKNLVSDPTKLKTHDTHISPKEAYERLIRKETDEYLVSALATDPFYSYAYAMVVLKKPFPLGEPAIYKNIYTRSLYEKNVLKGRPWTGLDQKVDEAINLKDLVDDPKKLKTHDTHISPVEAYRRLSKGEKDEYLSYAVAKDPKYSYLYARDILINKPFPLGEPAIAKDGWYSYLYARDILNKPFPLGEPAIAKDAMYSYRYAKYVLKGKPWTGLDQKVDEAMDLKDLVDDPKKLKTHDTHISPVEAYRRLSKGETDEYLLRAVAKDAEYSYTYAKYVSKRPFPLGEPAIAKNAEWSYLYAGLVLKNPFPLGEPAIAKEAFYAYRYAKYVLKNPFPLGEPAIYRSELRKNYKNDVLKRRLWTGLDQKVDEAMDLKNLVDDPKKLKTHDTHISPEEAYERLLNGEKDEYLIHAVAKDAKYSYLYAEDVLEKPFPLGEPAIAKSASYSVDYARNVLKKPFPLGEPAIAKSAADSFFYAQDVLSKPFLLGQPAIARSPYYAYHYARHVLKKPWPPGEPAIVKDETCSFWYESNVLKGKPWTGLKKEKVDEAMNLKNLVSDPTKLKTHDKYIGPDEALEKLQFLYSDGHRISEKEREVYERAIAKNAEASFHYALNILRGPFPLGEPTIAKNAHFSYTYAYEVLHKPFPLGEPAIMKDAETSYFYASDVINGRWEKGEPIIATSPQIAAAYAERILTKPWPLAEPVIAKSSTSAHHYAKNVLKGPFPLGEPAIYNSIWADDYDTLVLKGRPWTGLDQKVDEAIDLKKLVSDPTKLKTHEKYIGPVEAYRRLKKGETDEYLLRAVAKDPMYSCKYAENVLKGPFPLGEPTIAKDAEYSYHYATEILKGPFPLGEPEIAKDGIFSYAYALQVLKGPFPLGEPAIYHRDRGTRRLYEQYILKGKPWTNIDQKVDEDIDLEKLVSNPKKLKRHKTHISPKKAYERLKKGISKKGETKEHLLNLLRAVASREDYSYLYARNVLNGPFPLGESTIAKDGFFSYLYANNVLKKPWPPGEPAIAKDAKNSCYYAEDVLKGPFPLGEPVIYRSVYKPVYEREVLAGRPWTGLDQQVDEAIDLNKLVSDPTKLKTHGKYIGPQEAYERLSNGETDEYLIRAVAKDAEYSYLYALHVLNKKPFPLGEPIIATNTQYSYHYARYILNKKPFPLGEPVIAKNAYYSFYYARDVLEKPFPLGEPAIAEDKDWSYRYQKYVLKGRPWTGLGKKVDEAIDLKNLVSDPKKLQTHDTHISPKEAYYRLIKGEKEEYLFRAIAKDAHYSYRYATNVLKCKPFPLGEPAIAKNSEYSYFYANNVLKGPFPLGEPAIATEAYYSYVYALRLLKGPFPLGEPTIYKDYWHRDNYKKNVLKGKPWTGLPWSDPKKKVDEAIDLKNLVSDPKKLKTHDTHISPEEAYKRLENGETDEYLLRAVAKEPWLSYQYAAYVLGGPFPLGEPAIAKSAEDSYMYAYDVLEGPFPLGEPIIAKDVTYSYWYALHALKGPFPLGEPAIYNDNYWRHVYQQDILKGQPWTGLKKKKVDEAIDLKKLVSDPKKLKTVDTHISPEEALRKLMAGQKDEYLLNVVSKSADTALEYAMFTGKRFKLGEPTIGKNPRMAYNYALNVIKSRFPLFEPIIATETYWAHAYAAYLLKGPFPLGEPAIATDPNHAFGYASFVIKKPFPLGEPAIAKKPPLAYSYALNRLQGPFPLGEPAIAKMPLYALRYAQNILKGRFKLAEKTIHDSYYNSEYQETILKGQPWPDFTDDLSEAIDLKKLVKDPKKLKTVDTHISPREAMEKVLGGDKTYLPAVAKDPDIALEYALKTEKRFKLGEPAIASTAMTACRYAAYVIDGRWKLGEPAIAKDSYTSFFYANQVLKGPFPLGEPAIAENPLHAHSYARIILDGPFPLGEPIIATSGYSSLLYATEVLKGPFPLGEPAIAKDAYDSYGYARDVLRDRFYMGEPIIYKSRGWVRQAYKDDILKGRPWDVPKTVKKSPSNKTEKQ